MIFFSVSPSRNVSAKANRNGVSARKWAVCEPAGVYGPEGGIPHLLGGGGMV